METDYVSRATLKIARSQGGRRAIFDSERNRTLSERQEEENNRSEQNLSKSYIYKALSTHFIFISRIFAIFS